MHRTHTSPSPRIERTSTWPAGAAAPTATVEPSPSSAGSVDVHGALSSVLRASDGLLRLKRLRVALQLTARSYTTNASPERVQQVLQSMLATAIARSPAKSTLTIRTTCPSDSSLRVEVLQGRSPLDG